MLQLTNRVQLGLTSWSVFAHVKPDMSFKNLIKSWKLTY